jgi:hypothetical protein
VVPRARDLAAGASPVPDAAARLAVSPHGSAAPVLAPVPASPLPPAGAESLVLAARALEGRPRADLLVQAALSAGADPRERGRARALLAEALELAPTHLAGLPALALILERDGDLAELATLAERAARAFLDDPATAVDLAPGDGEAGQGAAARWLERCLDLYRFHLDAPLRALAASERLLALRGEAPGAARLRDELLLAVVERDPAAGQERLAEAVEAWACRVEADPADLDALRRLRDLRLRAGQPALAALAADLLVALGVPATEAAIDPRALQQAEARRALRPARAASPASSLASPHVALLELVGVPALGALDDASIGPRLAPRAPQATLPLALRGALEAAAAALAVDVPPVYAAPAGPPAPCAVGGRVALLLDPAALAAHPPAVQRFLLGRALSLARPWSVALVAVEPAALLEALTGLGRAREGELGVVDPERARRRGRALEKALPAADRERAVELAGLWVLDPARPSLVGLRDRALDRAAEEGLAAAGALEAALAGLALAHGGRVERRRLLPLIRHAASRAFAAAHPGA